MPREVRREKRGYPSEAILVNIMPLLGTMELAFQYEEKLVRLRGPARLYHCMFSFALSATKMVLIEMRTRVGKGRFL